MSSKSTLSPNELRNLGIGLLGMGMISVVTSFTITESPISYMTLGALLLSFTGIGFLVYYYIKTDKKRLAPLLYLAACMLAMVLVYYFAITHV